MTLPEEEVPEEELEEEEDKAPTFEELRPGLYRFVYNQPTVILSILEVLLDSLVGREIMTREEADAIIREGLRRWRDEIGGQ